MLTNKQQTTLNNEIYIAITMKEYIEAKLKDIEQDILKESSYNRLQSLMKDRSIILYLLSFYI